MYEDKDLDKMIEEQKNQSTQEKVEPSESTNKKEEKIDPERELYVKSLAEAEAKEKAELLKNPTQALDYKLSESLADTIENSSTVKTKVANTAQKIVDKGLKAQENKADASVIDSEDETLEADFRKNKNEYLYHGIDHKIDKQWKRNIIHLINDIWFVIWAIISCFSIVPVSTFLSRIQALSGFIKGVAIILGIVLLIACLGGLTIMCLRWAEVIN